VNAPKKQFTSIPICSSGNSPFFPAQMVPDEVYLWRVSLDKITWDFDEIEQLLSADERKRSERFVFERDQRRFMLGRAVLRMILGRCLSLPPEEVSFRYERYGKPVLDHTDFSFNISESDGCAVYAITRNRRIGVDIERIRDIAEMDQIARRFFSSSENELLCTLEGSRKRKMFFEYWTRKEALIKAVGSGLKMPLHSFDVTAYPDEPTYLIRLKDDLGKECQWAINDLARNTGFAAAVAVESSRALPLREHIFCSSGEEHESDC